MKVRTGINLATEQPLGADKIRERGGVYMIRRSPRQLQNPTKLFCSCTHLRSSIEWAAFCHIQTVLIALIEWHEYLLNAGAGFGRLLLQNSGAVDLQLLSGVSS